MMPSVKYRMTTRSLVLYGIGVIGISVVAIPEMLSQARPDAYRVRGEVHGRVQILPRTESLKVAEPNEILLRVNGEQVHSVGVSFIYYGSDKGPVPETPEVDLPLMHDRDGAAFINVVPEQVGKVHMDLNVYFADGNVEGASVDGEVALPNRKPKRFYVMSPGAVGTIYMDTTATAKHATLFPMAVYDGAMNPVAVPVGSVRFKITWPKQGSAPVSIDDLSGRVTALHRGHALVITTFNGLAALTCIDVMENAADGSDRTVCKELVPSGMATPASGFEDSKLRKLKSGKTP